MLGVLIAVVAVVVGTAAATGWPVGRADRAGTGWPGERADVATDPAVVGRAGVLVAQGPGVTVERVELPAPTTIGTGGAAHEVTAVYHVTVSAGPYVMRDQRAVLAADGIALGVAAESVDLGSLELYTYDEAVVTDGVIISLTYGLPGEAPVDWSTTLELLP